MANFPFEILQTEDGTPTLKHKLFDEAYHSTSAGAVRESLEKFFLPSGLSVIAKTQNELRILEVGFGLGYNCVVTLYELLKAFPHLRVEYTALELEPAPIEQLNLKGTVYGDLYEILKREIPRSGFFEFKNARCSVIFGDARKTVRGLPKNHFDAVYHDAFSPKKNAELWSLEFLEEVLGRLKRGRFWITYSAALPVRRALFELGAEIFNTKPVGRKRPGTAAGFEVKPFTDWVYPLSEKELEKLKSSPYAVPFRDFSLSEKREVIYLRWKEEVEKRLKGRA
jgi:chorismate dehydratase